MRDVEQDDRWVVLAFVERFLGDRHAGRAATLADYVSRWPDHAATIEREYRSLVASDLSGTRADEPFSAPQSFLPERVGSFRIDREIGRGGQAVVYRARDERLKRDVALKVLRLLPGAGSRAAIERFRREAVSASRLAHPAVCGIHEIGESDGLAWVAMPFVPGTTLARAIAHRDDPGDPAAARLADLRWIQRFFVDAARALHAVHEVGVLHRDIKPGNLMVTPEGGPVILDFGLAQDLEMDGHRLTLSGDILGTPSYLAPEQISGARIPLDRRTDVWALGVTLYETLTGARPFDAATRADTYRAILAKDPAPPWKVRAGITRELSAIVLTAIEKDPDRRYQDARLFAEDLERALEGRPVLARPTGPLGRTWRVMRRHPVAAAGLGVALLSLVGGLIISLALLHAATDAREDLRLAQRRDRERLDQMRSLAQEFLSAMTYDVTLIPTLLPFRERLSEQVIQALDSVSSASDPDPELIAQRLTALRGRAALHGAATPDGARDLEVARRLLDEAAGEAAAARRRFPAQSKILLEAVGIDLSRAQLDLFEQVWEGVLDRLETLAPDLEAVARLEPEPRALRLRCVALELGADAKMRLQRTKEAVQDFAACLALRRRCLEGPDGTADDTADTGLIALKLAQASLAAGAMTGSRAALDEALALAEDYAETRPDKALAQDRLADVWRFRAYLATAERNLPEAKLAWRFSSWFQERSARLDGPSVRGHQDTIAALDKLGGIARESGDRALAASVSASRQAADAEIAPLDAQDLVTRARELRARPGAGSPETMQAYLWLRRAARLSKHADPEVLAELALAARDAGDRAGAGRAAAAALALFGSSVPEELESRLRALGDEDVDRD